MSVRSSSGAQLERASILSVDSKGKRILALPAGYEGIRCNETRPHALSSPTAEESREERAERDGRAANQIASLSDLEREVLRLQGKLKYRVEQRITIAAGELKRWLDDGYTLIPGSDSLREGKTPVTCVEVIGYEVIEVAALDYEHIAERLELTLRQVHRVVSSANKKLRAAHRR